MRNFVMIALLAGCVLSVGPGGEGRAEEKEPAKSARVLHIRSDLEKAYAQGLKEKKPVVMIFVCPLERESCKHCRRFRGALFAPQLAKFDGEAIYVMAEVDITGKSKPTLAYQVFQKLGGKSTPMVSCLEPNPKMLEERFRLLGYFSADKLEEHFQSRLALKK